MTTEELYRKYSPMVMRRCLRLLGNREQAAEAMQDVFMNVVKSGDLLKLDESPSSLLYQIATRVSLNLIRKNRRRPEVLDNEYILQIANFEDEETRRNTTLFARSKLEEHDGKTQLIATYYWIDGMTLEEVAQECSMSVSGVRKRLDKFKLAMEGARHEHRQD